MSKTKKFVAIITENRIQLLITLVSVVIAVVNFLIVFKLQPVAKDLDNLTGRVDAISNSYVRMETFNVLVDRINHISGRVDQIYGFLK